MYRLVELGGVNKDNIVEVPHPDHKQKIINNLVRKRFMSAKVVKRDTGETDTDINLYYVEIGDEKVSVIREELIH